MPVLTSPHLLALTCAFTAAPMLVAQDSETQPADAQPADAEIAPDVADAPAADAGEAKHGFGFLSDPDEEPNDIFEALTGGKVHFDNRFRIELADTTGADSSTAITNRIRLGHETKSYHGFSGFIEMENVSTLDEGNYYVPATGDGTDTRTVVADPTGTEVNQAYLRYHEASTFDSGISLDVRAGRQRIILDDSRFVGNVGWRQFEQTYDAVRLESDLGVEGLGAQYAYVWRVQRIFGPDGPNWDSNSHFVNVSYVVSPELKVTPFAYLLDFDDDSPMNSVNTYGIRLTGALFKDAEDERDLFVDYEFTYARQSDTGDNPVDFEADFVAIQGKVTKKGLGAAVVGYQLLGSDDGAFGFRFPLGTNHKFQGFADLFLVTPATGLQDLYVGGSLDLPYGVKSGAVFHQFWSDEGGMDLGYELDVVASKKINKNWSVLVKGAYFDGHNGLPDTTRAWFQTTLHF